VLPYVEPMGPPAQNFLERTLRSLRREPAVFTWFVMSLVAALPLVIATGVVEHVEGKVTQTQSYVFSGIALVIPLVLTALIHWPRRRQRRKKKEPGASQ